MSDSTEFDKNYAEEQLRRSRHPLRRLIRNFYIKNILRDIIGPTIDFGCGAGQLLAGLPINSVGLEINPYLVSELSKLGLKAALYDPSDDLFQLRKFPERHFETLVLSHVLEHFSDPTHILRSLCLACERLGVQRIIVVVPGAKGFRSDSTHKTFINQHYFEEQRLLSCGDYAITKINYFPIDVKIIGDFFAFHELKIVYDRKI